MSKPSRREHRRNRHTTHTVTQMCGAGSADDLDFARKESHDILILSLGDKRRSGISWAEFPSAEGIERLAELFGKTHHTTRHEFGNDDGTSMDGLKSYLEAHPDGYLVIAMCEAVKA